MGSTWFPTGGTIPDGFAVLGVQQPTSAPLRIPSIGPIAVISSGGPCPSSPPVGESLLDLESGRVAGIGGDFRMLVDQPPQLAARIVRVSRDAGRCFPPMSLAAGVPGPHQFLITASAIDEFGSLSRKCE